jgi:hypothetical protein
VWTQLPSQHITLLYETDEDEFKENDSDMKEDDKSVSEYTTDEEEFSPGSPSNGLSSTQPVTLGQSNRQPGDTLQFPAECPQVQDEHPWLKTVCEEDAEEGDGGVETEAKMSFPALPTPAYCLGIADRTLPRQSLHWTKARGNARKQQSGNCRPNRNAATTSPTSIFG